MYNVDVHVHVCVVLTRIDLYMYFLQLYDRTSIFLIIVQYLNFKNIPKTNIIDLHFNRSIN